MRKHKERYIETKGKRRMKKNEQDSETCGTPKIFTNVRVMGVLEREKEREGLYESIMA